MRTAWKHGVTGIDDADSNVASVFYADAKDLKNQKEQEKNKINGNRTKSKNSWFNLIFSCLNRHGYQ